MFLPMSQSLFHTFSILTPKFLTVCSHISQSKLQIQPQKAVFYFDLFLFSFGNKPEEQTSKCNILPLVA